ncbi:MAG TPA: hypothetical protein VMT57_04560 [Candidatus Thermoplasmatota archaeon]|nr:hypothetical protein [Candidatus Thermoplasmatota archaeon]
MILATKENGQTNYSGSLRIAFINDDEPITDSFLWAKYVVELVFSPPPHRPDTPSGETTGKVGVIYTYSTSTIEPYEGQVYYLWDWGDGTTSKWLGPCDSGASCQASHIWTKKDAYAIKVKAKNIHDTESNWSDPLPISMPQNNAFTPLLQVLQYLERLFERFPNAFPFLRHLMGD